jgi:hypothetical protein
MRGRPAKSPDLRQLHISFHGVVSTVYYTGKPKQGQSSRTAIIRNEMETFTHFHFNI